MKNYLFLIALVSGVFQGFAQDSLNMRVLLHWEDPAIPPAFFINNRYNEVWGWHDPVKNREYAIMGSSIGIHFIDINSPGGPQEVAFVPGVDDMIHRDFKNKGKYLYIVADEHASDLQIVDMSYLPDSVSLVYESDALFNISHNVWIDGDYLYVCIPGIDGQGRSAGLSIYDISNPVQPQFIQAYTQYGNVHDLYSRNDTAYLHSEWAGMYIVDFRNPLNPVTLASFANYPYQGYNHSGWLTPDGRTYVFTDETHGMPAKILDVSDFSNLTILNLLAPGMNLANIDTNMVVHNPLIRDKYVFLSHYYDGVRVFDISNPASPSEAGYYDTYPQQNVGFYHGNWGVYPFLPSGRILASDMQHGLFVLEFAPFATSGIEKDELTGISVFPNPVEGQMNIQFGSEQLNPRIVLFDLAGRKLLSHAENGRHRQLAVALPRQYAAGVYILQIETNKGKAMKKISIR